MKPTMFQCMVTTICPISLRPMFDGLCRNEQIVHVHARAPGSLGQSVRDIGGDWKIGSLDIKVCVFDLYVYSVFVFQNGKIKISGGSRDFIETSSHDYDDWLKTRVIEPILTTLNLVNQETSYEYRLNLLNGSFTLPPLLMNMANYTFVCERIGKGLKDPRFESFESLVLPSRLIMPKKRGRICSMSLKYKKGTLRFDHGGKVQLFAFKSLDDMGAATTLLVTLLETVNSNV